MQKNLEPILRMMPPELRQAVARLPPPVEEFRLRTGRCVTALAENHETSIGGPIVTGEMLQRMLSAACGQSLYTVEDSLSEGYLTLPGGHRIGFCGTVLLKEGKVRGFRDLSSAAIRVAGQMPGTAMPILPALQAQHSLLLAGPPGAGKTTVLRDAVSLLSDKLGYRVGLCDERGEVAAVYHGAAQFHVGRTTDILTGCSKHQAIEMLVRTMNPQWIAVDEITRPADVEAIVRASYCGVRFLATAHANGPADLIARPVYRQLLAERVFSSFAFLTASRQIQLMSEEALYGAFDGGDFTCHSGSIAGVSVRQTDSFGISNGPAASSGGADDDGRTELPHSDSRGTLPLRRAVRQADRTTL